MGFFFSLPVVEKPSFLYFVGLVDVFAVWVGICNVPPNKGTFRRVGHWSGALISFVYGDGHFSSGVLFPLCRTFFFLRVQ